MTNYSRYARVWNVLCRVLLCAVIGLSALSATSCRSSRRAAQCAVESDVLLSGRTESVTLETVTQAVAGDSVKLEIPIAAMQILPNGAAFTKKRGRTRVSLKREGESVVAEAESDSALQTVTRYEHRARDELQERETTAVSATRKEDPSERSRKFWAVAGAIGIAALIVAIRRLFK